MEYILTFGLIFLVFAGAFAVISGVKELATDDKTKEHSPKTKKPSKTKPTSKHKKEDKVVDFEIDKIDWNSNGSGIIISKDGYIATNHHVISNEKHKLKHVAVEFNFNDEIKSFKAKLIRSDINNDLAIIKIEDRDFKNLNTIPYSIRDDEAELGEEVFALGYPMALAIMGKDIKFTDGRISSKTGYQGNVSTYQSTTPIQAGNSGGPLFDYNGNFLGIDSSGLGKDITDNVSYTIKTSYLINLINVLPKKIRLPKTNSLLNLSTTEKIKTLSKHVVLIKTRFE